MAKITLDFSRISDKQRRFMEALTRYVAYGGGRGGGKSWAVRAKSKLLALSWPGIKILLVRRTYPELLNNHINQLRQELNGVARYAQDKKLLTFRNGSTIKFGYCATDSDILQYQGAEYDVVFIDEASQLKKEWLDAIDTTVRGTNGFPKRTYYTLNPGGQSHGYFKRLFIDRIFEGGEKPENYTFIQALVTDNKALMETQPEYVQTLQKLPEACAESILSRCRTAAMPGSFSYMTRSRGCGTGRTACTRRSLQRSTMSFICSARTGCSSRPTAPAAETSSRRSHGQPRPGS